MKAILKILTKSATRRVVAFAISAIVSAVLGLTLDQEMVVLAVQLLVTIALVATADAETAEDILDGLDRDPILSELDRN